MKTRNYLLLCVGISVAVVALVLAVPAVSDAVEGAVLSFLSTNAG